MNQATISKKKVKSKKVIEEFDKPEDSLWMKFQRRLIWHTLRGFYRIFYRLEVKGLENIPEEGAFIVCGNHVDFMKVPVIVIYATRKINFIGKAELFNNPFLARLGKLFDVIPVKRGKQDVDSMKNSLRVLAKGEGLGLFPEGTRNGIAKKVKVKNGAAFMALRTGKPIVPVGIKVEKGKIIVLNMNIAEYKNLSKIIAAYLKLDFQTEVMARLAKHENSIRSVCFISDEYHEYVTDTDADFFAQSREAKCINIVATQSYTSLLNSINNQYTVKVIIQNLINKFWFRTDDTFTIEDAQKQLGKEDKQKFSKSISESSKDPKIISLSSIFSYDKPNFSESLNEYTQYDFIFDTNFFTQRLNTFSCLAFLSTGESIIPPQKIDLTPYFIIDKDM